MSQRTTIVLLACLGGSGCGAADSGQRCLEGVCFALPAAGAVTSSGHQHTIRLTDGSGWIDIQEFQPGVGMPTDAAQLGPLLARRYEMQLGARVLRVSTGHVGNRPAAIVDVALTRPAGEYRRRALLAGGDRGWIAIDATGPGGTFAELSRAFEVSMGNATWSAR